MMFNHRRQSRDLMVCQDILHMCKGKKLYMSEYSARLFEGMREAKDQIQVLLPESDPEQADRENVCFIEDRECMEWDGQIQEVVLYRWNRRYPADQYFPLDLSDGSWELKQTEEFRGSSHERITKEIYGRIR